MRIFRVISLFAVGGMALLYPAAVHGAQSPQAICAQATPQVDVSHAALEAATQRIEKDLADQSHRSADAQALNIALEVAEPPPGTADPYDPLVLARYCGAVGEAMRVATAGSETRARSYLLSALLHAGQVAQPELTARLAYRLALASGQSTADPGSAATRRELRAAFDVPAQPLALPEEDDGGCASIFADSFGLETRWHATRASLQCALVNSRAAGNFQLAALADLQLARSARGEAERRPLLRETFHAQAREAAISGATSAARLPDPKMRFALMSRLIESALDSGEGDSPAMRRALVVLGEAASPAPEDIAIFSALRGRVDLAAGRNADAAAAFRTALFHESQRTQPLRLADWHLLLSQAEPGEHAQHVMRAYQALEAVRPLLPFNDPVTEESIFALRMQPIFKAAIAAQLNTSDQRDPQVRIANAQRIVETFRQAEMESTFGTDCVPPRDPIQPEDLTAGEVLLYPIVLEDRVELLVADADGEGYRRLAPLTNASRDEITVLVGKMAFSIAYGEDDSWQEPAARLYQLLIAPIESRLGPGATLVIIPDGALRLLPFAALRDASGTLLIERTRLSVAPALAYAQPGSPLDRGPTVIAASVEERVELPAGNFPALAGTSAEARLAAGLGDERIERGLFIENFERAELERAFATRPVDILHLATHATFNGRSERSFIVASDGAISLGDLRGLIEANRSRGKELSLIVLSACETAVGDERATMGLAGTAVQAGAQSAVASLWQVDDTGTAELMRQFYTFLSQSQSRAEALRNAQLALIKRDDRLSDPAIWSAFSLMGGWR